MSVGEPIDDDDDGELGAMYEMENDRVSKRSAASAIFAVFSSRYIFYILEGRGVLLG